MTWAHSPPFDRWEEYAHFLHILLSPASKLLHHHRRLPLPLPPTVSKIPRGHLQSVRFSWGLSDHIPWALRHLNYLFTPHTCGCLLVPLKVPGPPGHMWHSACSSLGELRPPSYKFRVRGAQHAESLTMEVSVTPASSLSFTFPASLVVEGLPVTSHPWVLGGFIMHFPFELI